MQMFIMPRHSMVHAPHRTHVLPLDPVCSLQLMRRRRWLWRASMGEYTRMHALYAAIGMNLCAYSKHATWALYMHRVARLLLHAHALAYPCAPSTSSTADVPIDPETGEPVSVDTPNEVGCNCCRVLNAR